MADAKSGDQPSPAVNPRLQTAELASPERARQIMEERGRALAKVPEAAPLAGEVLEIVTFRLGAERYGIEAAYVREVVRLQDLARVPGAPDFLAGVANLRGEILAVVDLHKFFGLPARDHTDSTRVIVLGIDGPEFGILADAVRDAKLVKTEQLLEPPGSVAGVGREHLRGVTEDALIVVDGAALLREEAFFIDLAEES